MKFFSTFFIALFLFGLCLVEKELKRRALESQGAEEDFVESSRNDIQNFPVPEAAFAGLQNDQNSFTTPKLQLAVSDSTSAFNGSNSSLVKQL
ncbi:hypothetical protein [Dyadobacter psychrotolerans]|uniref:Uncharacterized protein n=1 Tax=Dyadobacter psychrotolerans TaxID=2541721 RepID=A0A4R5DPC9_9BACT|nr:hypothetical protein [Dyadobacter psychrotolerans]TDE13881.1 hypothetical protein E0F88_18515 [Dyadobacter psychrotolerans]